MSLKVLLLLITAVNLCLARIHRLEIKDDVRRYIPLSTFGFYQGGVLTVKLINFTSTSLSDADLYGFTLDRTLRDVMNPYLDSQQDGCVLTDKDVGDRNSAILKFILNFKNKTMSVSCSQNTGSFHIFPDIKTMKMGFRNKRNPSLDSGLSRRKERGINDACSYQLSITKTTDNGKDYFSTNFIMAVSSTAEEGLYNLYLHNCPKEKIKPHMDFIMEIEEENNGNYLSAGEMPLPALYFMMAILFFLSGSFWIFILRKSRHPVFKIHYLMGILVYLKSLSLFFHAVNYHYIETRGEHVEAWAILYYIAHLLKGAVLFITIVLIGTGWTFIKHILAEKDKKLFMIVIPLQVLANIAEIIIEESEEGDIEHKTWRDVFIMVDLICCGAILFPVVWSIRHLQEASATDGKAAINLRKLKLFRHFYIMIVCYIYFTRIIVYLLKMTVPFQYEWLDEMFREMATYVFFVLTGYKFRPASANPYFVLNAEEEPDVVLTETGITENLSRVSSRLHSKTIVEASQEEKDSLIRESSHEYD